MTSSEEAPVVPIMLTVDGRTGYTVWAAPWVEDDEEWQAFLGAGSKVFVFENLADMAAFLASNQENDLSDHPSWAMLQTLPAEQLEPDKEYHFDLDAVPGMTERSVDEDLVGQVGDIVDMVHRIAECCDNGPLLGLMAGPGFVALLDTEPDLDEEDEAEEADEESEVEAEEERDEADEDVDEDEDDEERDEVSSADDPWEEIGASVRRSWPLLIERLDECLAWYEPGERPETEAAAEPDGADDDLLAEAVAQVRTGDHPPTDKPDVEEAAEGASGEKDDDELAGPEAEEAARFWNDIGIIPVRIATPAGEGYTLRCYVEDEARFLGSDLTVDVFATAQGLVEYCQSDEEHDLSDLETWATVREADPLPLVVAREDSYDLTAAEAQLLAGPYTANPIVLRRAADFLLDLAEYCELDSVREALDENGPLGQAVSAVLHPSVGGLYPVQWSGGEAASRWRDVVAEVETCLRFHE